MDNILFQMAIDKASKKEWLAKLLISVRLKVSEEDRIMIDLEIIDLWNKVKPQDLELVSNEEGAGE